MPVKKLVKALYLLIVGLIVFTGALMIARGARLERESAHEGGAAVIRTIPLEDHKGGAA